MATSHKRKAQLIGRIGLRWIVVKPMPRFGTLITRSRQKRIR